MPAQLTRECPGCREERTPAEFRGDRATFGRPPGFCAGCRAKDPALQQRDAYNTARRGRGRALQRRYAARTPEEVARDQAATHPTGWKTCPPTGGCGAPLQLSAFSPDRYQFDGLAAFCRSCNADHWTLDRSAL